jgi:hypothetical protein
VHWLSINYQWVVAVVAMPIILFLLKRWADSPKKTASAAPTQAALSAKGSTVSNSPVASGSGNTQNINAPVFNVSLPASTPGAPGNQRYSEWRELIHELHESFQQIGYAFLPLNVITPGIETNDYQAGIRRGYRVLRNRILIADLLKNAGMMDKFQKIVEYAVSTDTPRDPSQRGCPTRAGFVIMASKFEDELMELARKDSGLASIQTSSTGITQRTHSQPETPTAETPRANLVFCSSDTIAIQESWSSDGVFFQHDRGNIAAVVRFSNDAVIGAKNEEAVVKAAIIYRDGARELLRVTGCWLEQGGAGVVRFRVDDSHKLIIGLIQGGEFCVLDKCEVLAHRRRRWTTKLNRLGKMPKITALVRLTGASSGYCYFEGEFEVTTNPLSISIAQAA